MTSVTIDHALHSSEQDKLLIYYNSEASASEKQMKIFILYVCILDCSL